MNGIAIIRRLHQHRNWVNAKLLTAARGLSEDALRRPMAIGQGSVWKSLAHLYAAEYVWLETLLGHEAPVAPGDLPNQLPGNQQGANPIGSLDELCSRWRELDARWEAYLAALSDADLDGWVTKITSRGDRLSTRRGDVLIHLCTHAQYTTAQVINMLRQLGASPLPDPMLITLARQEPAAR
jgi:uncharacterized damage-inducible protein DinB